MRRTILSLILPCVLLAAGCGRETEAPEPATDPAAATAAPAEPTPAAPAAEPMAVADGEFGVPECDEYVRNYLACLENVPEAARAMVRQSFDQSRSAWQQAATTPEGRAGLASACEQAEAAARTAMQAYGCQWGS